MTVDCIWFIWIHYTIPGPCPLAGGFDDDDATAGWLDDTTDGWLDDTAVVWIGAVLAEREAEAVLTAVVAGLGGYRTLYLLLLEARVS